MKVMFEVQTARARSEWFGRFKRKVKVYSGPPFHEPNDSIIEVIIRHGMLAENELRETNHLDG